MSSNIKFLKVGRVYWIKPKPIPGMPSKERPAIMLNAVGKGKTLFIQLGSTKYSEKSSLKATAIFNKHIDDKWSVKGSYIHLDASKPEWNTVMQRPHHKDGKYIDIPKKDTDTLRQMYQLRQKELEVIRVKKAKVAIINGNDEIAKKQLLMLKEANPIKHKNLNVNDYIENFKTKLNNI